MSFNTKVQCENINSTQCQYDEMSTFLLNELEESKRQFPGYYSKPVYILTIVEDSPHNQFKLCLQQANQTYTGERILLIPYQLERFQWIEILLEIDAKESIKRAEYIDPMIGNDTVSDELQEQFIEVYPSYLLQLKNLEKSTDSRDSAKLIVKNLLTAAKEGNQHKICELQEKLNNGLEEHNLRSIDDLLKEIQNTREEIELFQKQRKDKKAEEGKKLLHELEELKRVSDELSALITVVSSVDSMNDSSTPVVGMAQNEHSRKRLYIENLQYDSASMPEIFEKTIMELLIHFEQKLLGECVTSQEENTGKILLQKLQNQAQKEKLLSDDIKALLTNLEIYVVNNNCESVVHFLNRLLNLIRPLNLQETERLIPKANQSAGLVRDKDIVLLIGQTGSGKSTTTQFLAGCRMKKTDVEIKSGKFLKHITTDGSRKNPQLDSVISSPFSRSETRYITPVTVQLSDIIGRHENGVVTLCDGPGFGDTAGSEVDIANSLGVIEALKQARSVKLLVLSSYDTLGGRGEGIQKLARILTNMVSEINERLYAIVYAFTKYPEDKEIDSLLVDIKCSQVDKDPILQSDSAFVAVLTDMIENSKDKCYKIDPLPDSPKILLRKLNRMRGISNPHEVFRFPMNTETQMSIDKHIQRDKDRIDYGIKYKNNKLVAYYLKDFKKLKDLIQKDHIRQAFETSILSIRENVQEYCSVEIKKFNRLLASHDELNEDDVRDYKESIEYLQQIEIIKEDLGESLPSSSSLIQNVIVQLKHRKDILDKEDLNNSLIGIYLDNFLMLKNTFKELEIDYRNSCKEFKQRFDDLVQFARDSIVTNDFQQISETFVKLSKSVDILRRHLNQPVDKKYEDTMRVLLHHLNTFSDKIVSLLVKINLTDKDIEILSYDIAILKSAKDNYLLREQIAKYRDMLKTKAELTQQHSSDYVCNQGPTDLDEIFNEYITKISNYVDKLNEQIKAILEANKEYALQDIEKLLNNMQIIRSIPEVEFKTVQTYYSTIENIRNYMQQIQPHTQQLLLSIDQQSGIIDDRQLERSFSSLKNIQWIDKVTPGTYDTSYIRIKQELIDYAQQLKNRLKKLDLNLKCPENVCVARDIIEKMDYLCTVQQEIPELEEYRKDLVEYFIQRVEKVFVIIQEDIDFSTETISSNDQSLQSSSTYSLSDNDQPDFVFVPCSSSLERKRKVIENSKLSSNPQIAKMNSYVNNYNRILGSSKILPSELINRVLGRTDSQNEERATKYLEDVGFSNIEDLKQLIAKVQIVLLENEEQNERLCTTDNYAEAESRSRELNVKRHERKNNKQTDRSRLSYANNALMYLKHCEEIRDDCLKEAATNIHRLIQNRLEKYIISLVEQKIMENFKQIIRTDNHLEPDLFQYAQNLETSLRDLVFLRKLSAVFQCIDGEEKMERCKREFLKYLDTLSHKLEEYKLARKSKESKDLLFIAETLSCVDRFFGIEFDGYGALHKKYPLELIEGCEKVYKTSLEYINKDDYESAAFELSHIDGILSDTKTLAQIRHGLERSLNKLVSDTEYSTTHLDENIENEKTNREQVAKIKQNIETIRMVLDKENIIQLLGDKTQHRLKNFPLQIDEILSMILLENLRSIEKSIDHGSFLEAEKGMEIYNRLQRGLTGCYTSEDVMKKNKIVNQRLNDIVTEISKQNDFSDISNYAINPPKDILEKLQMTASHYGEEYSQAYRDTLVMIKKEFISLIRNLNNDSFADRAKNLRLLNNALVFLPDELRNSFQLELDEVKALLNETEKVYREKIEACFSGIENDNEHIIRRITTLADELRKQKLDELFNQLCDQTLKRIYMSRKCSNSFRSARCTDFC